MFQEHDTTSVAADIQAITADVDLILKKALDEITQVVTRGLVDLGIPPPGHGANSSHDAPHTVSFIGDSRVLPGVLPSEPPALAVKDGNMHTAPAQEQDNNPGLRKQQPLEDDFQEKPSPRISYTRRRPKIIKSKSVMDLVNTNVSPLQQCVNSRGYESYNALLIFLNSLFIGWQTEHMAQRAQSRELGSAADALPFAFFAFQTAFCLAFLADLVLRCYVDGSRTFLYYSEDHHWNILDVVVVVFGIVDLCVELIIISKADATSQSFTGNLTVIKLVRILRVARVARLIRIMKIFRELRMMIASLIGCLKPLVWVTLVLVLILYVFGICFTGAVTSHMTARDMWMDPAYRDLVDNFGSLDRAVYSLYSAITGGDDWDRYYSSLREMAGIYQIMFLFYITFAHFAVTNVVTGVFVDAALQHHQADKEIQIAEELRNQQSSLNSIRDVFLELDVSGDGLITLQEFESRLNDEAVVAYFRTMKLDVSDAKTLFRLLDADDSDEVDVDEFVTGCYRLAGEATNLHSQVLLSEIKHIKQFTAAMQKSIEDVRCKLTQNPSIPGHENDPRSNLLS